MGLRAIRSCPEIIPITRSSAESVARAEHLLGPWTKDPGNPVITANEVWRCPGHGTAVQTPAGQDLFIYHAYPASGTVYLGRESIIDWITWSADGWPVVNRGRGAGGSRRPFMELLRCVPKAIAKRGMEVAGRTRASGRAPIISYDHQARVGR